jgi:DNA transformation protein
MARSRPDRLPGFGPKSTAVLAALGVHTLDDLRQRGVYQIYRQLKGSVPGTSLNFMYALIGAVEGRDWREVKRSDRTQILMRLDEMGIAPE